MHDKPLLRKGLFFALRHEMSEIFLSLHRRMAVFFGMMSLMRNALKR